MYIDKTYPFDPVKCPNFRCLDKLLGENNLLLHYNNIYCCYVDELNTLLQKYPNLQSYSLDELIFNKHLLPTNDKNRLYRLSSSVYNHHVFFSSITDLKQNCSCFNVYRKIVELFGSIDNFYEHFISNSLSIEGSGYVFLVCDEQGNLSIFKTSNFDTPIPFNLYPLLCIDMWEHSYYLKFNVNKKQYILNFLSCLNWEHIDREYTECINCLK